MLVQFLMSVLLSNAIQQEAAMFLLFPIVIHWLFEYKVKSDLCLNVLPHRLDQGAHVVQHLEVVGCLE